MSDVDIWRANEILDDVAEEFESSEREHKPYNSAHEAYGVLAEEVAEFFEEVRMKRQHRSKDAMKKELIQIAAVAVRTIVNLDL